VRRLLAAAGILAGLAALWMWYAVAGDRSLPAATTNVVIERGDTLTAATQHLRVAGVLAEPLAFRLLARLRGADAAIQSGAYRFPPHQTTDEILRRLVEGRAEAVWVTIPEGFTIAEIAQRLAERHLADAAAFDRYARTTGITLDGRTTPSLEGYLFPSTYLVPVGATPATQAHVFTDQFNRELPPDATREASKLGLRIPQVIAVASLIEREAQADDERALMAGVYYNRMRAGMPLQVDATIEYVFDHHHTVITRRDLEVDSPYNTYRHTGLPPTPIANPGKASIDAAFAPRPSRYLYYVYRGHGHHAFATTLQEHNANVERYLNQKE
jgi:UPF0755 protein